jgi:hypothetical protein
MISADCHCHAISDLLPSETNLLELKSLWMYGIKKPPNIEFGGS